MELKMNNIVEVKFVKTHPDAILPYKNHMGNVFDENGNEISVSDTGYDLTCVEDIEIEPRSNKVAPVGLSLGYIEELADVLIYCRNMLDKLNLDEDEIINSKMDQNESKYPVEKSKGKSNKYNEL